MNQVRLHIKKISSKSKEPHLVLSPGAEVIDESSDFAIYQWHWEEPVNKISISLVNKSESDTILKDGKIVEDLAAQITKIEFNGTNLIDQINFFSLYLTDKGKLVTNGYLGFNGSYHLKFRYNPYYMSLLCSLRGQS